MKKTDLRSEDAEDLFYIEKIEKTRDKKKKINKKEINDIQSIPAKSFYDEENVEFILMDFKIFEELNKFKYIKSLTLIQQGIKSVDTIAKCLYASQIEFLCLNENLISNLASIEKFKNLKNLQLNNNLIEKIEYVESLENLETLWICENKIRSFEVLPTALKTFWVAGNLIEIIPEIISHYKSLEEFNLSANLITKLSEIFKLKNLTNLKNLLFNDVTFGENPICLSNNYRIFILHRLKNLKSLDLIDITYEESKEVEKTYVKKKLFYTGKIKQMNKFSKSILKSLKAYRNFFIVSKSLQIMLYSKKTKMLEFARSENTNTNLETESNISKDLQLSNEKIQKFLKNILGINSNFFELKKFISEVNDFQLINNFFELESFGNLKLEHGTSDDKWVTSCSELMRAKLCHSFMQSIKGINFLKIFKIFNKQQRLIFDNLNDYMIDMYNKFGDDKKAHEFLFMSIEYKDRNDLINFLLNGMQDVTGSNTPILLSNSLNEITRLRDGSSTYITIICKCFYIEEIVATYSGSLKSDNLKDNLEDIIKKNLASFISSGKTVAEVRDSNTIDKYYYYYNKALVLPEFLVEYDFSYNSLGSESNIQWERNQNVYSKNQIASSYLNKFEFDENFKKSMNTFNDSCRSLNKPDLFSSDNILDNFDVNFFGKFSTSKLKEFEEINSTPLYFAKSSVGKFMNDCFKFNSSLEFEEEMDKINNKLEEINHYKFQVSKIETLLKNEVDIGRIKVLNLFNCNLTNLSFREIISKFSPKQSLDEFKNDIDLEELRLSSNDIHTLDLNLFIFFPNLKILDLSHNSISEIKYLDTASACKLFGKLSYFDLSFNKISKYRTILEFINKTFLCIDQTQLENFNFFGNPIEKNFLFKFPNFSNRDKCDKCEISEFNSVFNLKEKKHIDLIKHFSDNINSSTNISLEHDANSLKTFNITHDTYSFSNKYLSIAADNELFKEQALNTEDNLNVLFLSKKKLNEIPNFETCSELLQKDSSIFNIKILYLNFNKISKLEGLENFTNLLELYLQNNKIKKIENLSKFVNLLKLDLSSNQINSIEGLSALISLRWLNLENNIIESFNVSQFAKLPDLAEINIASNFLTNFKELIQLRTMENMIILDISGNEVCNSVPDFRTQIIFYLNKIKVLNKIVIEKNEVQLARDYFDGKITSDLLGIKTGCENVASLVELNLSNCKLKDVSCSNENFFNFETAPNLKKLDLSRNLLTCFKIFGNLPNLTELNLNSNLFEKILNRKDKQISQKGILGITNLETLEMSSNSISDLFGIQILKNLRNLILSRNNLNKIDFIDGFVNLNYLDLSFNKLRNVEKSNIGLLPNLRILLCDSNYLKTVNSFSKLINLVILSFDSNKIQNFQSIEMLTDLENLKEINLNNNPINSSYNYRFNMIRKFPNLIKIDTNEVSKEEKEMATIDLPINIDEDNFNPYNNYNSAYINMQLLLEKNYLQQAPLMNISNTKYNPNKNSLSANINSINLQNMQKLDKPAIKVKYVHLDLGFGQNQFILPNNKNVFDLESHTNKMNQINLNNIQNQVNVQKRLISPKKKIINGSEFNLPQINQTIRERENSTSVKSTNSTTNKKQLYINSFISSNINNNIIIQGSSNNLPSNQFNLQNMNTKKLIEFVKREVLSNHSNVNIEQSMLNRAQDYYNKLAVPRPKSNFNSKNRNKK